MAIPKDELIKTINIILNDLDLIKQETNENNTMLTKLYNQIEKEHREQKKMTNNLINILANYIKLSGTKSIRNSKERMYQSKKQLQNTMRRPSYRELQDHQKYYTYE